MIFKPGSGKLRRHISLALSAEALRRYRVHMVTRRGEADFEALLDYQDFAAWPGWKSGCESVRITADHGVLAANRPDSRLDFRHASKERLSRRALATRGIGARARVSTNGVVFVC
jgi:hypothetical protein